MAQTATSDGSTGFGLLRRRDFGLYWVAQMVAGPGTWAHNITASVLMLAMTGSPFMVGVVNFAIFIPTLLLSLPAGSLGDRFDRRAVVALSQAVGCVFAVVLTVLSAQGALTPWLLVALCFAIGCALAVGKPALAAILPALVRKNEIARATALNVMQFQFGQIVGPGLASLVLVLATPTWGFGINAVSFLPIIAVMRIIRLDRGPGSTKPAATAAGATIPATAPPVTIAVPAATSTGRPQPVREGLRYIRSSPLMPAILVGVVLTNSAVESLRTLAPTLSAELGQAEAAGIVIMGYSVGALFGLLTFGLIEKWLPQSWLLVVAFALQAFGAVWLVLSPSLAMSVAGAVPIGIGFSISTPLLSAALQNLTDDAHRSRVMSVFSIAHLGFRPVFSLVAGALASLANVKVAFAFVAVVAVGSAVFARQRRVGQVDQG